MHQLDFVWITTYSKNSSRIRKVSEVYMQFLSRIEVVIFGISYKICSEEVFMYAYSLFCMAQLSGAELYGDLIVGA